MSKKKKNTAQKENILLTNPRLAMLCEISTLSYRDRGEEEKCWKEITTLLI